MSILFNRFCRPIVAWLAVGVIIIGGASPTLAEPTSDAVEARAWDHIDAALDDGLEPWDFHHLLLAFEFRTAFATWQTADQLLDRLGGVEYKHPLMNAEVRLLRSRLAVEQGRPSAARAIFSGMGGLTRWWAEGPHELEELGDFAALAVQPGPDADWRFVPGVNPIGWVRLQGLGWPARRQILFLSTTVNSTVEQPVAVRLGAAQAARVWLNGEPLLTTDYPLRSAEDQVAVGGWLREGPNNIAVAVASETADWWLRMRLTAPDGSDLVGVQELDTAPEFTPPVAQKRPSITTLGGELRTAAGRDRPGARLALAALLVDRSPEPRRSGAAREACRTARKEDPVDARILEWLVTEEPATTRDLLEEIVALGGPDFPARTELARWYAERGLNDQAHEILKRALDIPAVHSVALDLDADRWGPTVMQEITALSTEHPACLEAIGLEAQKAFDFGRWPLLRSALGRLLDMAPGLAETQDLALQAAGNCGEGEELRRLLAENLQNDPNRTTVRIRLARLEAAEGDIHAAEELLEDGLHRCPGHVEIMMETAFLEHHLGRDDAAVAIARRVLQDRPQERRAEHLLELLGEGDLDETWKTEEDGLWALVEQADHLEGPWVTLLDHRSIHFLPANLTEEKVQRVFHVRDAQRSRILEIRHIPHIPESQRLRVTSARILRADGTEVSARHSDSPRLSEPEFNLYYDTRLRVLQFDGLRDGDIVEIVYVLTETAEANETGAYKGGLVRIAHPAPTLRTVVELMGREEYLPSWEWALVEGEPVRTTNPEGEVSLRWVFNDLAAIPTDDPPGPNLLIQPYLVYSNHPEWSDLSDWYERHVATRIRPSRRVEEVAEELVATATDRSERISRIYGFVTTEIRYVGLEFGEHRFRPFSADWVLDHKMGDCKDSAGLLVALFTSVGIQANMVMVRTADLGPVAADLALLEDFNHAIAYLPDDDLWLDGTAAGHDPYPPPGIDQNAWVMVVGGSAGAPFTTPAPGAGAYRSDYSLSMKASGRYDIVIRTEDTGEAATIRRGRFGGSRSRVRFSRWLQDQFPGAELVGDPVLALTPGRGKATMEIRGEVDRTALQAAGGLKIYPGEFDLDRELTPTDSRSTPLLLPVRPDIEWTLEIETGQSAGPVPENVEVSGPYGTLGITVSSSGTVVRIEGRFHLNPGLVAPEDVGRVRAFLVGARRSLETTVEIP